MDKIDFVGNAIFIPFFLISVGMIVDLSVIVTGWETILFVCTITSVAIITKWVAAYIFGKIYKLTKIQYSLLFGLSSAHAAATLAIIFVGVRIGIVDSSILNATVVLILITCIVSSFVTENYGRKVALTIQNAPYQIYEKIQRILVPISNPNNIKNLMEFGLFIKDIYSKEFITSLMVFDKEYDIEAKVTNCRMVLDRVIKEISPNLMNQVQIASRIDISPSSGILRAIKELLISDIVIGLSEKHLISDFIFGSIAENLVSETNQCIYIVKITYPLNTNEKIFIFLAANAELEEGFENLIVTLSRLCINIGAICVFCCFERTSAAIRHTLKFHKIIMTASFETAANIEEFDKFKSWIQEDDMICFINSRFKGISYDSIYDNFLHKVAAEFQNNNFAIIYPEQSPVIRTESYTKYDIMDSSAVGESMKLVETIKKWFAIIKVN